ncbi:hypothetical protein KY289_030970 [Solanum tuberosum]|nr:hypothetical protein KY289_030970 [Solanum tuberosum]
MDTNLVEGLLEISSLPLRLGQGWHTLILALCRVLFCPNSLEDECILELLVELQYLPLYSFMLCLKMDVHHNCLKLGTN